MNLPLAFHCASPLGLMRYYFFLRVETGLVERLGDLVVTADLDGLHSTKMRAAFGTGFDGLENGPVFLAKSPGRVWLMAAAGKMARGDGVLRFEGVPADFPRVDLLACTWPRYVREGWACDGIALRDDPSWAPGGVPLGGVGVGRVDICRDGRFRNFSGNNNQDMPFEQPDGLDGAYLSVTENGTEKLLATRPMGDVTPVDGGLSFDAVFPQAWLSAASVFEALDVSVLFSGALTPHDVERSCLPVALAKWTLTNRSAEPRNVVYSWSWPNLIGMGGGIRVAEKSIGRGDGYYSFYAAPGRPALEEVILGRGDALARGCRMDPGVTVIVSGLIS